MSHNFFQVALKMKRMPRNLSAKMEPVYDYIDKYWKKTRTDLESSDFDLEECFTFLYQQLYQENDREEIQRLLTVIFTLKTFLTQVLSEFEHYASSSSTMTSLGQILLYEKPTVLTFNYDCIIESVLEFASGVNAPSPPELVEFIRKVPKSEELPDNLLSYSFPKWNRPLGYGIKFDEIQLKRPPLFVEGARFYSDPKNTLYVPPILKMHGSVNWFKYVHPPTRAWPSIREPPPPPLGEKESDLMLSNSKYWMGAPLDRNGWYVDSVIITPNLYKDRWLQDRPFQQIWSSAKAALLACRKLVIIGYSFSPTDFNTKKLLLESLSSTELDELIVVDPDPSIASIARNLCHFTGGVVWHTDLASYLHGFSGTLANLRSNELWRRFSSSS
jgi:hypothetical protein